MDGSDKALCFVGFLIAIVEITALIVARIDSVLLSATIGALSVIAKHIFDRAKAKKRR
jgi:hypothetical protein